jgi:hypothetical protein
VRLMALACCWPAGLWWSSSSPLIAVHAYEEGSLNPFKKDSHLPAAYKYTAGCEVFDPLVSCIYENGDPAIEVFLFIVIFKLAGSFGLVFELFREVVGEDLKPGGVISFAQDILEFRERLGPAPVESSSCLVEIW